MFHLLSFYAVDTTILGDGTFQKAYAQVTSYVHKMISTLCAGDIDAPLSIEGRSLLAYQSWVCRDQSLYITSVSNQDHGILLAHLDPTPRWTEKKKHKSGQEALLIS